MGSKNDEVVAKSVSELRRKFDALIKSDDVGFSGALDQFSKVWAAMPMEDTEYPDPTDDFGLVLLLYSAQTGNCPDEPGSWSTVPNKTRDTSAFDFIRGLSRIASSAFPSGWSEERWFAVLSKILSDRYGGRRLRIKKRPLSVKKRAAKTMTPKQLMTEFGISKSHAYRLVAVKK
jgi:hypothetical protein